jgi:hypothetical protein
MNKKYKVEFPKELCSIIDQKLLKFNHCVVHDSGVWNQDDEMFFDGDGVGKYIPRIFLKDVEDIKVAAKDHAIHILHLERSTQSYKESVEETRDGTSRAERIETMILRVSEEAFISGAAYEKKKHEPERSCGECADEYLQNSLDIISRYEIFELGWKAYAKNRRYDD